MRWLLALVLLAAGAAAEAQTPCQGGTATAPACARNWATGPLNIMACPAVQAGQDSGVRVVLRELNGTPLLSAQAAAPGAQVTLASASAPRVPAGGVASRVLEFTCEGPTGQGGAATFATITFPVAAPTPAPAPTLLP